MRWVVFGVLVTPVDPIIPAASATKCPRGGKVFSLKTVRMLGGYEVVG